MKIKQKYRCQGCFYETLQWIGRCPECGDWNSFSQGSSLVVVNDDDENCPKQLSDIKLEKLNRFKTGIEEFDRVLGGGVVKGSVNLLGGEPGIGKSTLLMQLIGKLVQTNQKKILYISGEESEQQIAKRAERLKISSKLILIYHSSSWEDICKKIKLIKPYFLILDSIQTTVSSEISASPGSVSQVREITHEIVNISKSLDISSFVISHINKAGNIAGPKVLEHMVDSVLYFEGDQYGQLRILRGIKNRYGSNSEVGLFEMTSLGLNEVDNPSKFFLDNIGIQIAGRCITCVIEGSRPIFLEVQSLVIENNYAAGKRNTQGVDPNRLAMLVAIVEKFFEIDISGNDIYVNLIGATNLKSRESDLAIIASLVSSYYNISLYKDILFLGEVGLTGEIRSVQKLEIKLQEATKLGFKDIITSSVGVNNDKSLNNINQQSINLQFLEKAQDLMKCVFDVASHK